MSRYSIVIIDRRVSHKALNIIGQKYNLMFTLVENLYIKNQLPTHRQKQLYLVEWLNSEYCFAVGDFAIRELSCQEYNEINMLLPIEFQNSSNGACNYFQDLSETTKREVAQGEKNWNNFLEEYFKKYSYEIGLLLHWYETEIEKEKVFIKETQEMVAEKTQKEYMHVLLEDDVLYTIKTQGDGSAVSSPD